MIIIDGPIISDDVLQKITSTESRVVYSIQLTNGMVITSPDQFASAGSEEKIGQQQNQEGVFLPAPMCSYRQLS
jgi:hypothetical protein